FAVWATVGFFEVTDDSVRPVVLGAEIGRDKNRQVRHRMFAIVDRSSFSVAYGNGPVPPALQAAVPTGYNPVPINVLQGSLPRTPTEFGVGLPWQIREGSTIIVDAGTPSQEAVVVKRIDFGAAPYRIYANFTKAHAMGAQVTVPTAGPPPVFTNGISIVDVPPKNPGDTKKLVQVPSTAGSYEGIGWAIKPGMQLVLDVGGDQEFVTVTTDPNYSPQVTATTFIVDSIAKVHRTGFLLSNTTLGNPGPQPRFDPRDSRFSLVVRHLSIID